MMVSILSISRWFTLSSHQPKGTGRTLIVQEATAGGQEYLTWQAVENSENLETSHRIHVMVYVYNYTYIYHENEPKVGRYTTHGWYGFGKCSTNCVGCQSHFFCGKVWHQEISDRKNWTPSWGFSVKISAFDQPKHQHYREDVSLLPCVKG